MDPILPTQLAVYASELRVTDANEATTRLKLIDSVIFDLLGWTKMDVKVEERATEDGKTSFYDYLIRSGSHSILIEAKKIGQRFDSLPSTRKSELSGKWASKGASGAAINQAKSYARTLGVGFCAVTNGIDWVIFPINRRDGVSFENSLAVIFKSIEYSNSDDLLELSELLSRDRVISGSLEDELLGSSRDQNDVRRLNSIYDKSFSRVNRTSIFPAIEREIVTAFNEGLLADNPDLLEKCYVQTPERTRFDSRIKMYLNHRDQVLKTKPIRPIGRRKDAEAVKQLLVENKLTQRSIALLAVGLVGAGKTTFLNYVSRVSSGKKFDISKSRPHGCWIQIDFRDFSQILNPRDFILNGIFEYIINHPYLNNFELSISLAYSKEIDQLRNGPLSLLIDNDIEFKKAVADLIVDDYKSKEPYARKIISQFDGKIPIFLVVDNVDQIESPEIQSNIFLEATALARSLRCNLVLAMRDVTYVKNRSSAVFDAFDFDAVYIDHPDIKAVLSRRFTVALQLLQGRRVEFVGENGAHVVVDNAALIIEMLSSSVLGTEVGRMIEMAATGDTRLALQMTRQFLQHGYSSTGRAVAIYQRTGKYQLPPHEALRAIMLGNQNIYRESFSSIGNPFDSHLNRNGVQFLRLYLMSVLVLYSSESEFSGISVKDIFNKCEQIGIGRADVQQVIDDLIGFRIFFTKSHQNLNDESQLLPSRLCGYIVRDLISRQMFLETTMFDTFIYEKDVWNLVETNMKTIYRERDFLKKFNMRREVVKVFFKYCQTGVETLVNLAQARALPPQWCSNPMTRMEAEFKADVARASRSAVRNYGQESDISLPLFSKATRAMG
jgi:GTPase SAR1 family protein